MNASKFTLSVPDYITSVCVLRAPEVIIVSQMRAFLTVIAGVVFTGIGAGPAGAAMSQAPAAASPPEAPAAYDFMLGRHLEDERTVEQAIAADKKASALAADSAELRAER